MPVAFSWSYSLGEIGNVRPMSSERAQFGRPTPGTPGSPPAVGAVRQLPTDGYGCESGPAYHRVSILTLGLVWYAACTGTPFVAPPIACHASMTRDAIRWVPRSACAWPMCP